MTQEYGSDFNEIDLGGNVDLEEIILNYLIDNFESSGEEDVSEEIIECDDTFLDNDYQDQESGKKPKNNRFSTNINLLINKQ